MLCAGTTGQRDFPTHPGPAAIDTCRTAKVSVLPDPSAAPAECRLTFARGSENSAQPRNAERSLAAVMHALTMPPFVDHLLSRAESLRQNRRGLVTRLDRSPHLGRRRRLLVKMDQHGRTPFRMSLRTDLAMKMRIDEGLCDHQGWNSYVFIPSKSRDLEGP